MGHLECNPASVTCSLPVCFCREEAYLYKSELPVAQTEEEKRYLAGGPSPAGESLLSLLLL